MLVGVWAVLGVAGVLVVLTGWLPAGDAREVALTRGAPVQGFLVAITVLAELADPAGVFDAAAGACARLARGPPCGCSRWSPCWVRRRRSG